MTVIGVNVAKIQKNWMSSLYNKARYVETHVAGMYPRVLYHISMME